MDNNKIPGQLQGDEIANEADVEESSPAPKGDEAWLKFARDAYEQSTDYFKTNFYRQWENDLRMFNSQHPRDSKYLSDAYKYRSRYFRPKSRTALRKNEALAAKAFFSNPDYFEMESLNPMDPNGIAGAALMKSVMQYRLSHSIPWFLTLIGGFQDAQNVGIVASLNTWCYRSRPKTEKATVTVGDTEVTVKLDSEEVLEDYPDIQLIPVGNIKFHPAARWDDVVGTSPYLIIEMPMYVRDVLDRMETARKADQWRTLSEERILSARINRDNTIESARNNFQEDPEKAKSDLNEFDMVMCHLNFIKIDDECYTFWTLKDRYLLSDPVPVSEAFLHCKDGRPPVTIGFSILETHKSVKSSAIKLGAELQREINEVANQRGDNVKFVLNKRWKVRRGANVDVESIVRNVPGGVTMVNDVDKDVQPIEWNDVTASAYQEQDRLNFDYDAVIGTMDQSTMMANQPAEQPVGSMRMISSGAGDMTEYSLLTYVKTWVEPTLQMLAKMEAAYETDEVVLAIGGQNAQLQKFGANESLDSLLSKDLTLVIHVGMGSTDPDTRFQRLMAALGAYGQVAMQGSPDMNLPEIRQTLFSLAGFRDNSKFFTQVDPRVQQAQQMMQQAQGIAQQVVQNAKDRVQRREIQLNRKEMDLKLKELAGGGDLAKKQHEMQMKERGQVVDMHMNMVKQAQDMHNENAAAQQEMELAREKAMLDAHISAFEAEVNAELKRYEAMVQAEIARRYQPQQQNQQPKRGAK